jgi:hypothetical protein
VNGEATMALKMETTLRVEIVNVRGVFSVSCNVVLRKLFSRKRTSKSFCDLMIQRASSPILLNDSRFETFCVSRCTGPGLVIRV